MLVHRVPDVVCCTAVSRYTATRHINMHLQHAGQHASLHIFKWQRVAQHYRNTTQHTASDVHESEEVHCCIAFLHGTVQHHAAQ